MADISKEIANFQNAVYGEEVRGSMISLCEKVNDEQEIVTSQFNALKTEIQNDAQYIFDNMPVIQSAQQYATDAQASATDAKSSEVLAKQYADQASQIVGIGIATTTTAGIVKPDGTTISVDADGKITVIGGGGGGGLLPELYIISESDATVTVEKDSTILNPTKIDATTWYTTVPTFGTWTIHSVNALGDATYALNVDTVKIYNVVNTHFTAYITVNYTSGANVTLSDGQMSYTVANSGDVVEVHQTGLWTATASFDAQTQQASSVQITTDGQQESITLDHFAKVTVTYDADVIGKTITLSNSVKTYTKVATSSLSANFVVADFGTWTLSTQDTTQQVSIPSKGDYSFVITSLPAYGYGSWLDSIGITDTFGSLNAVLADEPTVRLLMSKHASCDYMLEWYDNDTDFKASLLASEYALKWIGINDYIYDKMPSDFITDWLGGAYWEYALKDHVPTMTSNTAPYGECIASSVENNRYIYYAFDKNESDLGWWEAQSHTGDRYVGYKHATPTIVKKAKVVQPSSYLRLYTFKVQGSNDKLTWEDISDVIDIKDKVSITVDCNETTPSLYHRILILTSDTNPNLGLAEVQFYGRALNVSVPTMTDVSAPYGVTSDSEHYSASPAWKAFDKNDSTAFATNTVKTGWLQYEFPNPVVVRVAKMIRDYYNGAMVCTSAELYASNDGVTWTSSPLCIFNEAYTSKDIRYKVFENDTPYKFYRFNVANNSGKGSNVSVLEADLFGIDYSERTDRHYIYDHGVEVETTEIVVTAGSSVIKKESDHLYVEANGGKSALSISNMINLTPYKVLRAKVGNELIRDSNGVTIVPAVTTQKDSVGLPGDGLVSYLSIPTTDLPNNAVLDISSLNDSYYLTLMGNTASGVKRVITITEWWLE